LQGVPLRVILTDEVSMHTFGIDVSHWEGLINWQLAAPSINFAYYKCTDGNGSLTPASTKPAGLFEAGLPHAPYHYFQPTLDPVAQAEHFIPR
jgi:GH25 family lysozyme M1 (1,4-beta-N-acetylmuramidase)